jgi:hypothetical protein
MDQNLINEEIKGTLNSGNVCYNSLRNLCSSRLPPKNVKIKIYTIIVLPVVLYGYETWFLTIREENRLSVFQNGVLRRMSGPKRDEVAEDLRKLRSEEIHNLYSSPNIIRLIKASRMRWTEYVAQMGRRGVYVEYWSENQKERDH